MPSDPEVWSVPTVRVAVVATVAFTCTQVAAAIAPKGTAGLIAVVWSLVLFAFGSAAFAAAFVVAAGRSRDEQVTIAGVVWLTNAAPAEVARALRSALIAQSVVALVTAGIRPFSAVAFGILAPMAGLGLIAWYGARHGTFASIVTVPGSAPVHTHRPDPPTTTPPTDDGTGRSNPSAVAESPRSVDVSAGDATRAREDPDDFDQLFRRRKRRRD